MKTLREYIDLVEGKLNEMDKSQRPPGRDITDTESPEETKRRRAKDNREGKKALAQTSDATKKKLGLPPYDKE
jgi:hypothetical protein